MVQREHQCRRQVSFKERNTFGHVDVCTPFLHLIPTKVSTHVAYVVVVEKDQRVKFLHLDTNDETLIDVTRRPHPST